MPESGPHTIGCVPALLFSAPHSTGCVKNISNAAISKCIAGIVSLDR